MNDWVQYPCNKFAGMLMMLCLFLSRVCRLSKPCFTCALGLCCCWFMAPLTMLMCTPKSSWSISIYLDVFNSNNSPFWGKELDRAGMFSKQLSTSVVFTNTDRDDVTWGCSLTVIVGFLNLSNEVTEWKCKVILWNFERKITISSFIVLLIKITMYFAKTYLING